MRDATKSIRLKDVTAERRLAWVFGDISAEEISCDVGIRQFQKLIERRVFLGWRAGVMRAQVAHQQQVEFLHAAPAAPFQALARHVGKRRRGGAVRGS